SHSPCGIALATGKRAIVNFDAPNRPDPDGSNRLHLEAGYRSAQSTPLISRTGRPIGILSTHWHAHHTPSERESRFLDLLARQAADAIERKEAAEVLREHMKEL